MFPNFSSGLTIGRVISGLSRTLQIANQVIPLYEQAKPMVQNARKAFSVLKEINIPANKNTPNKTSNTAHLPQNNLLINKNSNNPTFFQ